jgi:hypothetical protein
MTFGDTWLWDGAAWTNATPASGPPARYEHDAVYHAAAGEVMTFGGEVGNTSQDDLWAWNGSAWRQVVTPPGASARARYAMAYDAASGGVLVSGGYFAGAGFAAGTFLFEYRDDAQPRETCRGLDVDRDTRVDCADEDCWALCDPLCPPGAVGCAMDRPRCGDGTCGAATVDVERGVAFDLNTTAAIEDIRSGYIAGINVVASHQGLRDVLRIGATSDATGGNHFMYYKVATLSRVVQAGDVVEYDVFLENNVVGLGGIELYNTDGTSWRDAPGWADQNGVLGHPNQDLTPYAFNRWFRRRLPVPPSMVGKTIDHWDLAVEQDAPGTYGAYYDNIRLVGTAPALESCRLCPQDCGACAGVCGDFFCDAGETATSCPGDCP